MDHTALTITQLVAVHNALAEKPVKSFSDKPTAAKRAMALLEAGNYLMAAEAIPGEESIPVLPGLFIVPVKAIRAAVEQQVTDHTTGYSVAVPGSTVVTANPVAAVAAAAKGTKAVAKAIAAKVGPKAKPAAKAKPAKAPAASRANVAETATITSLLAKNPKRGKSGARFQIIIDAGKKGIKVGAYLDACVALEGANARPRYGYRSDITKGLKAERITVA